MGQRLSEDELQQALDFCGNLFAPTSPEEHRAAEKLLAEKLQGQATDKGNPEIANPKFLDVLAPVVDPRIIETVAQGQPKSGSDVKAASQSDANVADDPGYAGLDMKKILKKVNARRAIHSEQGNGVNVFETEPLGESSTGGGWVAKLEKGKLGLAEVEV